MTGKCQRCDHPWSRCSRLSDGGSVCEARIKTSEGWTRCGCRETAPESHYERMDRQRKERAARESAKAEAKRLAEQQKCIQMAERLGLEVPASWRASAPASAPVPKDR